MTEQDRPSDSDLADVAGANGPAASAEERPRSGADRRTDPDEPNPAANQRAGEHGVEPAQTAKTAVPTPDSGVHRAGAPSGEVAPD